MSRPDISIIIPTYNEAGNLPVLVERLAAALAGRNYELVVVDDDSPDCTWRIAEELAKRHPLRIFRRIGKRGLSSAVVDGFASAQGESLAVIDADLQHDPAILPRLVDGLAHCEAAVGTRYAGSGSTGEWGGARLALSRSATWSVRRMLGVPTSDPMSGYFAIRRELFQRIAPLLQPRGYKILLEILHRGKVAQVHEEAYTFSGRLHGESKLGAGVLLDCAAALWELRFGEFLPLRFVKYSLVGLSGVGVQLLSTHALRSLPQLRTEDSQLATAIAIAIAMASNYVLDNLWTFRDLRHRSAGTFLGGFLRFSAVCSVGAAISWSIAQSARLATDGYMNIYFASLIGIAVATIWNYVLNRHFTWKPHA